MVLALVPPEVRARPYVGTTIDEEPPPRLTRLPAGWLIKTVHATTIRGDRDAENGAALLRWLSELGRPFELSPRFFRARPMRVGRNSQALHREPLQAEGRRFEFLTGARFVPSAIGSDHPDKVA
jgi:hypothetical protein